MTELLKQAQYKPMEVSEQVVLLFAATSPEGFIDALPVSALKRYETEMFAFLRSQKASLLEDLKTAVFKTDLKKKDDPVRVALVAALNEFKALFVV